MSDLGLTLPHFEFLDMFEAFCTKYEDFDQIYLNTDSKTQNVEKLGLDLIFYYIYW